MFGKKLFLLGILLLSLNGMAQTFTVSLANGTNPTTTTFEVDVMLTISTPASGVRLSQVSVGVNFNQTILNGGTPSTVTNGGSWSYIGGKSAALANLTATTNTYRGLFVYASASALVGQLRIVGSTLNGSSSPDVLPGTYTLGRYRFTNTVAWTSNSNAQLWLQPTNYGGATNTTISSYPFGVTTPLTNYLSTTGVTLAYGVGSTFSLPLNSNVCPTTGASSSLVNVTPCANATNGSATITMSPTPTATAGTYTVDGGGSIATGTLTGGAFTISGLAAGNHSVVVTVTGCSAITVPTFTIGGTALTTNGSVTTSACDSYIWPSPGSGLTYNSSQSGLTFTSGCNTATLNLTIKSSTSHTTTATACDTFTWSAPLGNGTTYTSSVSGVTNTSLNAAGCTHTETLNLTINRSTSHTTTATACNTFTWSAPLGNGTTYTSSVSGVTNGSLNAAGCTHTETLNLTINNSTSHTTTATACDTFTWSAPLGNGTTYTSSVSGVTNGSLNAAGCTHTETLNLTINSSTSGTTNATACNTYTWSGPLGDGNTYTTSGTHTFTTANAGGCPHVQTLNLTINNSTSGTTTATACNSYVWAAPLGNGQTYTASNSTATFVSTNAAGCTHTQTLNLTINSSTTGTTTAIACNSYVWAAPLGNGTTYTASNSTATNVSTNAAGCSHTQTLNLTIKANPTATASDVSGCSGSSITLVGSGLPVGGSGVYSPSSPFVGSSSTTYTYTYTGANGCSTTSAPANITITAQPTWYLDADGDGYYSSTLAQCTSPGTGWTTASLTAGGDCDDTVAGQFGVPGALINPARPEVCYNNVDDNCNGTKSEGCAAIPITINSPATIISFSNSFSCSVYTYAGATSIAYRIEIERFANGVSAGGPVTLATQTSRFFQIPDAMRVYTTPTTVTTYKMRASAVINGEIVAYAVPVITVNSLAVPTIQLSTCPTALSSIGATISANAGLNATDYSFRIRLNDSNPSPTYYYINGSASRFVNSNSFVGLQLQFGMSYKVSVSYHLLNHGIIEDAGWGAECTMSTPIIPVTGLSAPACGTQAASLGSPMTASPALYATAYIFRVRLTSDNGASPTYYYTPELSSRFSQLSAFQGITLLYNTNYSISVQYRMPNGTGSVLSAFGPECSILTPFFPTVQIVCNSGTTTLTQSIAFSSYPGFPNYRIRLQELDVNNDPIPSSVQYIVRNTNSFTLSMFTTFPPTLGKSYNADVAIILGAEQNQFGRVCTITTASPSRSVAAIKQSFKAVAYPNPFADNFMLDVKTSSESVVSLKVYDMIGRLIEQRTVSVSDIENTSIGDRYPSGVYNVVVSQEDNVQTVRVVKR